MVYIKEVRIRRWMEYHLEGLFQIEIINIWKQEDIEIGSKIKTSETWDSDV
jgi:hypothetical protein